jgi:hypothetical protein
MSGPHKVIGFALIFARSVKVIFVGVEPEMTRKKLRQALYCTKFAAGAQVLQGGFP